MRLPHAAVAAGLLLAIPPTAPAPTAEQFPDDYWYRGEAELARYDVTRSRYGEDRSAQVVMVFVTEDFLAEQQTKLEAGVPSGDAKVPVLKLNRIERFATGVYDYSIMTSVFTPTDAASRPRTLKVTTSVQDWCGHVWLQLNLDGDRYRGEGHSYFQREADRAFTTAATWLEDELWNRVRLGPDALPQGELSVVPSTVDSRLRHYELGAKPATATLGAADGDGNRVYRLRYDGGRELRITFAAAFPHRIQGWRESDGGNVLSEGRLQEVTTSAYWNRNGTKFESDREALDLPDYR